MDAVKAACEKTSVKELISDMKIVWLEAGFTVAQGLKTLVDANIFSAPVKNKNNKPIGIVSCLDIMVFAVDLFSESEGPGDETIYDLLESKESKYLNSTVAHVLDHISESAEPIQTLDVSDTVMTAISHFKNGLHRLPIQDKKTGEFVGYLTQSAVVKFMTGKMDFTDKDKKQLWNHTVGELNVGTKPVLTVHKDTKTIQAFYLMRQKNISGVGVIDDRGSLIGNLSSRDLNEVPPKELYRCMLFTCAKFVQIIKAQDIEEKRPIVGAHEDSPLTYILNRMISNRIHRMYIVDQLSHPIKLISLRDCLNCIAKDW